MYVLLIRSKKHNNRFYDHTKHKSSSSVTFSWVQNPENSHFLFLFLYKSIVKHGVICHGKPELQAYA